MFSVRIQIKIPDRVYAPHRSRQKIYEHVLGNILVTLLCSGRVGNLQVRSKHSTCRTSLVKIIGWRNSRNHPWPDKQYQGNQMLIVCGTGLSLSLCSFGRRPRLNLEQVRSNKESGVILCINTINYLTTMGVILSRQFNGIRGEVIFIRNIGNNNQTLKSTRY